MQRSNNANFVSDIALDLYGAKHKSHDFKTDQILYPLQQQVLLKGKMVQLRSELRNRVRLNTSQQDVSQLQLNGKVYWVPVEPFQPPPFSKTFIKCEQCQN